MHITYADCSPPIILSVSLFSLVVPPPSQRPLTFLCLFLKSRFYIWDKKIEYLSF